MIIVLIKDNKKVAAFYNPKGEGYIEIDYGSLMAIPYKVRLAS